MNPEGGEGGGALKFEWVPTAKTATRSGSRECQHLGAVNSFLGKKRDSQHNSSSSL